MKKFLTAVVTTMLSCILLVAFVGCSDKEVPAGSGESVITGITSHFNTEYDTLKGSENIRVYRLKTGETYEFYVKVSHRGSQNVRLGKGAVEVYYDTQLFAFDEGEYWDEPDSAATPTDEFPFYFTCYDALGYTEIFVVANSYWCKVAVIIEN